MMTALHALASASLALEALVFWRAALAARKALAAGGHITLDSLENLELIALGTDHAGLRRRAEDAHNELWPQAVAV